MKTLKTISIIAFVILCILPTASLMVNREEKQSVINDRKAILDSISEKKIRYLDLTGQQLIKQKLSVDKNNWKSTVELRTCVENLVFQNDTLHLSLSYPGKIYWGTIRINGLEKVFFPNDTLILVAK